MGHLKFSIDNLTFTEYSPAFHVPLLTSTSPTKDVFNRDLTFVGQAKYNVTKVDADTIKLPDNVGELVAATNFITVNDWYNVVAANNVDLADINYQSFRQYYKDGELMLFADDAGVTVARDTHLKTYCGYSATAKYEGRRCACRLMTNGCMII